MVEDWEMWAGFAVLLAVIGGLLLDRWTGDRWPNPSFAKQEKKPAEDEE